MLIWQEIKKSKDFEQDKIILFFLQNPDADFKITEA